MSVAFYKISQAERFHCCYSKTHRNLKKTLKNKVLQKYYSKNGIYKFEAKFPTQFVPYRLLKTF